MKGGLWRIVMVQLIMIVWKVMWYNVIQQDLLGLRSLQYAVLGHLKEEIVLLILLLKMAVNLDLA